MNACTLISVYNFHAIATYTKERIAFFFMRKMLFFGMEGHPITSHLYHTFRTLQIVPLMLNQKSWSILSEVFQIL